MKLDSALAAVKSSMMSPLHPFEKRVLDFIRQHQLIKPGNLVLIGVSGGPDSTALLHVLYSLRESLGMGQIAVLHFDHRLRGEDSDADRIFVEKLAESLQLPCRSFGEDVRDHSHGLSLEMAARACRHRFFKEAMDQFKAQGLALGHNANDQAEEVLLRLLRGAGPSGAAGMLPGADRGIIRPLLFATRLQILSYLHDTGLAFREDASNLDPFCQRNALRLEVFPILEERFHPRVVETFCRHAELARDEEAYWEQEIRTRWPELLVEESASQIALKIPELLKLPIALQRRMLRFAIERFRGNLQGIYAVHIEAVCRWITRTTSGTGLHLPAGLRVAKAGERMVFFEDLPSASLPDIQRVFEISGPGLYSVSSFQLDLNLKEVLGEERNGPVPSSPHLAWIDADTIQWPLWVRTWQPGDRFQPMGLRGTKKLQDFFTDAKIGFLERKRIPLLCDREKICWIMGYRLDERVKITAATRRILAVEWQGPHLGVDGCVQEGS